MSLLVVSNITKHYGAELILENVSFRLERGDHVALIGSNGAGKSTLMRIVAGLEEPDTGIVTRARNATIAYLPQEPEFTLADTLYEAMLDAFREVIAAQDNLRLLEHEMAAGNRSDEAVEEYGRLQSLVEHAGYDYRQQIERVLTGLGLGPETWHLSMEKLSGGQRTRANLARTLLREADLLLLDEPTNHLDIPAVEWLETYLREMRRAFLIVAHDRYLLDRVTRRTVELSFHRVTSYDAPYSRYLELKAERMERQQQEYKAQQEHIAKTEEFIRRYGAGQRYKEARGRQKRLDRLERIERPRQEETVHLRLKGPQRTGDIALEAEGLVAGYPDTPLVRLPEQVVVRRGERIALIGPNGSGKTTLLRTIIGSLPPFEGSIRWGANTSIGYYSQTLEQLREGRTVIEEIQRTRPMSEEEARSYLGRFLFTQDDVFKTVGVLSGGERSRVALARLILGEPNALVLDEPTNHLDIASRDALEGVLDGFTGTLLFVSHDRYLIDALAQQLWVLQDGRLVRYAGGYSQYAAGTAQPLDRESAGRRARRDGRSASPEERLRQLEEEVDTLAGRLAEIVTTTSPAHLVELMDRYAEVQQTLRDTQEQWIEDVRQILHSS